MTAGPPPWNCRRGALEQKLESGCLGASLAFVSRRIVVLQQPDGESLRSSRGFPLLRRKILTRTKPTNVRQVPFKFILNWTLHWPSLRRNGVSIQELCAPIILVSLARTVGVASRNRRLQHPCIRSGPRQKEEKANSRDSSNGKTLAARFLLRLQHRVRVNRRCA